MAKIQKRRSISISRAEYDKVKAFSEANRISMSQMAEQGLQLVMAQAVRERRAASPDLA